MNLGADDVTRLFDQRAVQERIAAGELPDWAVSHYEGFRGSMLGPEGFPCHFGVAAERDGSALYTFCPSMTDPDALGQLRDTLLAYIGTFRGHPGRTPCVVFFAPPERDPSEAEWNENFWNVLQYLHDHDPEPWPADIPTDPDHHQWEFCFGGEPIFPTARAPFYERRRSRYTPHGLEITVQPREVFSGVTGDTVAGKHAREFIDERLHEYDDVAPHAAIGDWEDEASHEWDQYMLPEGEASHETCPIELAV
jgi:FPC/CPF motif-containing protein YcgG